MRWAALIPVLMGLATVPAAARIAAADAGPDHPPAVTPAPTPAPAPSPVNAPQGEDPPDAAPPPAVKPFESGHAGAVHTGSVELSNGEKLHGRLALTDGKTIRLFDLKSKTYHDLTFDNLKQIEVKVEYEKKEEEWLFKEGGNDEKIFSGNFYIDRRYQVRCTPFEGAAVAGYVLGTVFYLTDDKNAKHRYFLHKDERGENKQEAKDIVYVMRVTFDPQAAGAAADPLAPVDGAATPPKNPPSAPPPAQTAPPASNPPALPPQQQEPKQP